MSTIREDSSKVLSEGDPSRGRLSRKKAAQKAAQKTAQKSAPSMQQRRKSVAKKLMGTQELPDTYEEYEAMEDKPFLPSADVEAGKGMSGVAFKSREQSRKDAANLAMRESDQQKKLDKFTSIPSSFGREVSHYVTGDEYLLGGLMPSGLKDEAASAAAGLALGYAGEKKARKDLEETAFDRGLKTFQDYGKANKELMGDDERWLRQTEKAAKKELKKLGYEADTIKEVLKLKDLKDESSVGVKALKDSKALQKWAATKTSMAAKDELMKAAGKTAARKAAARKAADKLTRTIFKAIGENSLRQIARVIPAVGAVDSFLGHASSVFERSKELPNQLAQNARAMKRPLQSRDIENSVLDQLKENSQLAEDLYSRGVLSAKLYDSLTGSEKSVLEE